jgi:uncharacterized membrane protein YidH (DUF202 family)
MSGSNKVMNLIKKNLLPVELALVFMYSSIFALIMIPKLYFSEKFLYTGTGDTAVYGAGAMGFLKDDWRFPPFNTNLLGPEQLSVSLFDAIPFPALLTKMINSAFDLNLLNYIGIWTFIVFFMQPFSAWIACKSWKIKNNLIVISTVVSITFLESFQFRILHNALQSHFLIILAIALYPKIIHSDKIKIKFYFSLSITLLILATLTHTYLAVMVLLVLLLSFFERYLDSKDARESKFQDLVYFEMSLVLIFLISYTFQGVFTFSVNRGGWSIYSMNPLSPFIPNGDRFVLGQYEGLNYLGIFGIFLLLVMYLVPLSKNYIFIKKEFNLKREEFGFRRFTKFIFHLNWFISLGSIVYLGADKIIDYQWIEKLPFIEQFMGSFRCPGRLFWINTYMIFLIGGKTLDTILLKKNQSKTNNVALFSRRQTTIFLILIMFFQISMNLPRTKQTYDFMRNPSNYQSVASGLFPSVSLANKVIVFPEFECLKPPGSDIISYFHVSASKYGIPINTTKAARQNFPYSCNEYDMQLRFKQYVESSNSKTLLVLVNEWTDRSAEILDKRTCGTLSNVYYCYGFRKL